MRYQAAYSRITGIICGIQRRGAGNQRNSKVFSIELNYSNADYTAETDCYRTVEIRIERKQDNRWYIYYVTEFTYTVTSFGEESTYAINFDFSRELGYQLGIPP